MDSSSAQIRLFPWPLFAAGLLLPAGLEAQGQGARPPLPTTRPDAEVREVERLSGPPVVSARAWIVCDAKTGKKVAGANETKPLPMASTTKLMTALLVARLAESKPDVVKEQLQVSAFADATGGSSAKIRAGEKIAVGQLLYGLLLPSGNDAANALAEHFGDRFEPPAKDMKWPRQARAQSRPASWRSFVAEMNRVAKKLGMEHTCFWNPHGLDCPGHQTAAADLVILARNVLKSPLLRKYVDTRVHHAKMQQATGGYRPITWRNTNRLLRFKDYHGLKTGTTRKAGACLVSCGSRGEDQLIVVVLGASSTSGRYVDSRNLYRWAFRQLGHRD